MYLDDNRLNDIVQLASKIKKVDGKMNDIRYREWLKYDTKVSQALMYIISAENVLGELDDFSLENDQCYSEIETLYNRLAAVRADLTRYVDENPDILNIGCNNLNK